MKPVDESGKSLKPEIESDHTIRPERINPRKFQKIDGEEAQKIIERAVSRSSSPKDAEYVRGMLTELVKNEAIPVNLLKYIPLRAGKIGKTRFDQVYDGCMALLFPEYKESTLQRVLGTVPDGSATKIFRVMIPDKFGLTHVLLRADSFQQAFALGCDYVCRASVRLFRKIPTDLTIRVEFLSEKALCRFLDTRWYNRAKKRRQMQLKGREFTNKQVNGARLAALGHPKDPQYSIAKYAERKDLMRIRSNLDIVRISAVESESSHRKPSEPKIDE